MPLRQMIHGSDYNSSVKNYGDYFGQFREKSFEIYKKKKKRKNHHFARFLAVRLGMHFSYLRGIIG